MLKDERFTCFVSNLDIKDLTRDEAAFGLFGDDKMQIEARFFTFLLKAARLLAFLASAAAASASTSASNASITL